MENLRKKVIETLEMKLGKEYEVISQDKRKNNGLILHGICVHRKGDCIGPVLYMEEFIHHSDIDEPDPEEIADSFLKIYHQDKVPRNTADRIKDFGMMKESVGIRLINYAANAGELEKVPHRRFLDLAITYYLDMELAGQHGAAAITNGLMQIWGTTEDDLYRIGMKKLLAGDDCFITGMFSMLKQIMEEQQDTVSKNIITELEMEQDGPEMYVASNKERYFGANCLMNIPLLQELAEKKRCSLIIFPSSVHELVIIPQKDGMESCLDTENIQMINMTQVPRDEWLSNSIYRYDREKKEVSVYEEGEPLLY